ncbi:hypothetical protein D9M70_375830 [compost metagenome]
MQQPNKIDAFDRESGGAGELCEMLTEMLDQPSRSGPGWRIRTIDGVETVDTAFAIRHPKSHEAARCQIIANHRQRHVAPANPLLEQHVFRPQVRQAPGSCTDDRKVLAVGQWRSVRKHQLDSRTYLSALERGIYSPTMDKLDALASVLGLHPATLLASSYLNAEPALDIDSLLNRLRAELETLHPSRA